jgi:hypothetical protein
MGSVKAMSINGRKTNRRQLVTHDNDGVSSHLEGYRYGCFEWRLEKSNAYIICKAKSRVHSSPYRPIWFLDSWHALGACLHVHKLLETLLRRVALPTKLAWKLTIWWPNYVLTSISMLWRHCYEVALQQGFGIIIKKRCRSLRRDTCDWLPEP